MGIPRDRQRVSGTTLTNEELERLVQHYRDTAPKLAEWMEANVSQGLTVFQLPSKHRVRMRTSNAIERAVQQEIKRRTAKIRIFPNVDSLLRLVTAVLVEIDEKWSVARDRYIIWNTDDVSICPKEIYRHQVA